MRQIAVLIGILVVALIFNSLLPKNSDTTLDKATVERFILEDAKVSFGEKATYSIIKSYYLDGKWNTELDIGYVYSPQPGSNAYCKRTVRRYYSLFPIVFREELYSDTCN